MVARFQTVFLNKKNMAFKLTNSPYPKKGKKKKKKKGGDGEPIMDPAIFQTEPYSANSERTGLDGEPYSAGMNHVNREYKAGDGYVEGLDSQVFTHTDSRTGEEGRKRVQVESSPAFLKHKKKKKKR